MPKLLSPPPLEDWGFGVSSIMPMERLLQVGMKPKSSPVKSGENRLTRTAQGSTTHSTLLLPRLMQPLWAKLKATENPRDAQRLNRLDSPHANAWLSARPSCMDGTDTVLPPRIYRTAVARLLGQPVFSSAPCHLCEQTIGPMGDHPLCCKKSGDRITRHNRLRSLVFKLADTGL